MKTLNMLFLPCWYHSPFGRKHRSGSNYQGAARNAAGEPMADSKIGLALSITDGAVTLYSETFAPNTNTFGLFDGGSGRRSGTIRIV